MVVWCRDILIISAGKNQTLYFYKWQDGSFCNVIFRYASAGITVFLFHGSELWESRSGAGMSIFELPVFVGLIFWELAAVKGEVLCRPTSFSATVVADWHNKTFHCRQPHPRSILAAHRHSGCYGSYPLCVDQTQPASFWSTRRCSAVFTDKSIFH